MTISAYYGVGVYGNSIYGFINPETQFNTYTGPLIVMSSVSSPEIPIIKSASGFGDTLMSVTTVPERTQIISVSDIETENITIISDEVETPVIIGRLKNQKI